MNEDRQTYERAIGASLAGLAVQAIMALGLLILALWSQSAAVSVAAWHAFGGLGLWVCLWVVFQQHRLERVEALEAEQLARQHGSDSSIFETTADDLSVARSRLAWLYKWVVPIVSLATSAYLLGVGLWLMSRYSANLDAAAVLAERASPLALAFIAGGITFFGFLVSRYVAGMAKLPRWSLLRGGAAYLMGVSVIGAALTIAFFAIEGLGTRVPLKYLAVIIPVFMILVGIEIALNFVLDFYRPRRPGEQPRPAFDSRLLSLLTTPESFAHTISEAINYQFGFEITRSWFWQLLSRVFGRLVIFAVIVLLLMSCIVIVEPNQRALVTRFGQLTAAPLEPGAHLKLPWPVSQVRHYDVTTVRVMPIGAQSELVEGMPILWSNVHTAEEPDPLIVAPPRYVDEEDEDAPGGGAPSVSLVNAEVILQYRIDADGLVDYVLSSADAEDVEGVDAPTARLRSIADQQITRYLLRHSVDEWIGTGRVEAGENLRRAIQEKAREANLGIEVVSVSVAGVHPPQEIADAFHAVVGSEQDEQTAIENAERQAIENLVEVAGSMDTAQRIVDEIENAERMKRGGASREEIQLQERKIEELLLGAGGNAAKEIAEARGYRWTVENTERGKAERFSKQLVAYQNAPELYRTRRLLEVLRTALPNARKYIITTEYGDLTIRGDFKDTDQAFQSVLERLGNE